MAETETDMSIAQTSRNLLNNQASKPTVNSDRGILSNFDQKPVKYPTEFLPRIESFGPVHCAIDFDMANLSMVEVEGGFVAIDTGSNPEAGREVLQHWQQQAAGPLLGLIYTHSHIDHIAGASAFPVADIPIWAHKKFLAELDATQGL